MKAADYKEQVYRMGIPVRVREIEAEVQAYQRDHPDLFLSETPFVILRPELKNGASSNGTGHTPHPPGGYSLAVQRKRENSAALLAWIAAGKDHSRTLEGMRIRKTDMRGIHQLVNHGYLIRRGNKMVRTSKEYSVTKVVERDLRYNSGHRPDEEDAATPKATPKKYYGGAAKKKRQQSAELLAIFDTTVPKPPPPKYVRSMGSFVRRGYVQQRGKGLYVRTSKPYVP